MNIDGVDFWVANRHIMRVWDDQDKAGPFIVMIEEKVRVGNSFTIYIQANEDALYRILQRQCDMKHECNMQIVVEETKTRQPMYDVLFKVILVGLKFGQTDYTGNEPLDMHLTYRLIEAIDRTVYDKTLRKIHREDMYNSNRPN